MARYVHHALCKSYDIQTENKWHLHNPTEVILNKNIELLWDMTLNTDREVGANRPDIVLRDKASKKTYIIDISCPSDVNVLSKENEKLTKYSGLRVELGKMWDSECVIIPVVVGGLGVVSEKFPDYLKMIPAELSTEMCVKITLLGSERIMRSLRASHSKKSDFLLVPLTQYGVKKIMKMTVFPSQNSFIFRFGFGLLLRFPRIQPNPV